MALGMSMVDSLGTWSCFSQTTQICAQLFIAAKGLEVGRSSAGQSESTYLGQSQLRCQRMLPLP